MPAMVGLRGYVPGMAGDQELHGPGPERERLPCPDTLETCDQCGVLITDGTERHGSVPDSSAIHPTQPAWDGRRMVVACSLDHLRRLHAQARPFIDAELWAGKLLRALKEARRADQIEVSVAELLDAAGLTPQQMLTAVRWLERYDHDGS
ncbi:hypothetical protein ACFOY4_30895 [Actinomadura syzygii]|uniref:Uncharacterized protein n=1 Tax=Actinomadura syzygii TaxID=1427538 RepID=A0A5D0TRE6_9ACTN|nr:hypothetical protein [Actinomadura syzygii]TYC08728.1 hypothetical protein FXF65_38295 [Actinomadura syzygii]